MIGGTERRTYPSGTPITLSAPVPRDPVRVDDLLAPDAAAATPDGGFTCPRCEASVTARFYGPCDDCRAALRRTLGSAGRAVEREAYVPAMHVTPNAVALKE